MSLIRGVLLAGQFRTNAELVRMSHEDQRNTLIVELTGRSNQSNYQSFDDAALAGAGAVLVFLRAAQIRSDDGLRAMSADDQRNTLIVELGVQHPHLAERLQGFTSMELVVLGLGGNPPGADSLHPPSYLRGALLAGGFRTQQELNEMSADDQRNTLIVELAGHSNQTNYQAFDDHTLAGMGAILAFLRRGGIRTDAELQAMSADDQRNTAIVELDAQTRLGASLQGLRNMDLVRVALGVDPRSLFTVLPAPLHQLPGYRLQFRLRGFTQFQSTDTLFQGARDEVYLSAIGMDSSTAHFGPDNLLVINQIESPIVGDIGDDSVRGPWAQQPHVLLQFDLDRERAFPRSYVVTLLLVEKDNEDLVDTFDEVKERVKEAAQEAVKSAAVAAGITATSSAAGGVVGGIAGTVVGAAAGSAAGMLIGLALDAVFDAIGEGLANEVFSPRRLSVMFERPISNLLPVFYPDWIEFKQHGALYRLHYDWHIEVV